MEKSARRRKLQRKSLCLVILLNLLPPRRTILEPWSLLATEFKAASMMSLLSGNNSALFLKRAMPENIPKFRHRPKYLRNKPATKKVKIAPKKMITKQSITHVTNSWIMITVNWTQITTQFYIAHKHFKSKACLVSNALRSPDTSDWRCVWWCPTPRTHVISFKCVTLVMCVLMLRKCYVNVVSGIFVYVGGS